MQLSKYMVNRLGLITFSLLLLIPLIFSMFEAQLFAKFMAFAILAISIDLIWGYAGILSLGHGVFFGIGAYCMAMFLKLEQSHGALPDFMNTAASSVKSLPLLWIPFKSGFWTILLIILIPALVAFVIGSLTFVNRIRGAYFSILSEAIVLLLAFVFSLFLVRSQAGKVLLAIRDSEKKVRFTGYSTSAYKIFIYCISAILAAIAGALYVLHVGIITPSDVGVIFSIEMVLWVAVGGRGTIIGPVIGTFVVNEFKDVVSNVFPDAWNYLIGILFVVSLLFFKNGLMGLGDFFKKISAGRFQKGNVGSEEKA